MAGADMAGADMAGADMAGADMMPEEITWDDSLIHVGEVVSFSATVTDSDLEEGCDLDARLDYHWSVVRLPAESQAGLNRADARTPSLIADIAGDYTVRLVVTDAQGNMSAPVEVDFTVEPCGGRSPSGESVFSPLAPQAGDLISLNAQYQDLDEACIESILSYNWRFESLPAGSAAMLNDPQAFTPSFVADLPGEYTLSLIVSDESGHESSREIIVVTVSDCGSNRPVINTISHEPPSLNAGQALRFTADISDLDLDPSCGERSESFTYHWRLSESPAMSQAALSLANTPSAALVTDVPGDYEVSLVVSDERGFESEPSAYRVSVGACGFSAPSLALQASNIAPATGEVIALNATVSDADNVAPCDEGESFSYSWRLLESPAGSMSTLNNSSAKTPSFTPDLPGDYLIACVTSDSTGRHSTEQTITITANGCGVNAPVIDTVNASPNPRIAIPTLLSVTANDSDNDLACGLSQAMTYHWRLTAVPAGSETQILNANLSVASFIPDVSGEYVAEVMVTDETGLSALDQVSVSVNDCGVRAPQVDTVSLSSPDSRVGSPVEAIVTVSDIDEDDATCALDQSLSVHWEIVSAPVGSQSMLDARDRLQTSFTPDLPGEYTLRVRAQDHSGLVSPWRSETVSINNCGGAVPAIEQINLGAAPPYRVGQTIRYTAVYSDTDLDPTCLPTQRHNYQWRLISAPAESRASLYGQTFPELDLTVDVAGEYIIGLIITDELGLNSTESRRSITVEACGGFAPVVTDISNDSVTQEWSLQVPVRFSHDGFDPDVTDCGLSDSLSYHWSILSAPAGSVATLNNSSLSEPSLTPDVAGEYELSLMIMDSAGRSAMVSERFTASACGSQAPIASIEAISPSQTVVSPLAVQIGDIVQLDASGSSDPDAAPACGEEVTLSYQWTLLRVPPASEATLALPQGLTPWFEADESGLYRVQLVVSDGEYESLPEIFEINAN
jgi:PKD repeat protein